MIFLSAPIAIPSIVLLGLASTIVVINRKVAALKRRGLRASQSEIEQFSLNELRVIRDLLEPDVYSASDNYRERFRLIEATLRDKCKTAPAPTYNPEEH